MTKKHGNGNYDKPSEICEMRESLADSVNHLLVVGFYLINLGHISLALKIGYQIETVRHGIEALSWKVGLVLLVLGTMHFFNLFVFSRPWTNKAAKFSSKHK